VTYRIPGFNPLRRAFLRTLALAPIALGARAAQAQGSYAARAEVQAFVQEMGDRHGFDAQALLHLFRHASYQPAVIRAISPPRDVRVRSWQRYRARYLDEGRIAGGMRFWHQHAALVDAAQVRFGVPQEIMVAIIGVETIYGRMTGTFQTLSALATLAFDYPSRADLFRHELEELLLLARELDRSAITFKGSYAGAIGLPQFLPSSYRRYAIDFDRDGKVDLLESAGDAIGSVGNFLREHGWRSGELVAVPAIVPPDATALADGDVTPKYVLQELAIQGITPAAAVDHSGKCALIDLVTPDVPTEYWLGFDNFHALTRYNRSSFYAMAVFQLAEALRNARSDTTTG
jgi:membrane-bound lytic murein transglycosylase B